MTLLAAPTRVHTDGGRLVGQCQPCAQTLQLRGGCDRDVAVGAFFRHHPNSTLAVHRLETPTRWCIWTPAAQASDRALHQSAL